MRSLSCTPRSLDAALALGPSLLAHAEEDQTPWITASLVTGPAILLGAVQRAGRVVDLAACAAARTPVLRRATTGTAAYLPATALLWTLALPHQGTLVPDTTPATLLNRNVRPFLKGFARAGFAAHYFGREWIAIGHSPTALLGFDVAQSGAVLIEVIAGYDGDIMIPVALAAPEEQHIARWRGKTPVSLLEIHPRAAAPLELARAVVAGVAERARRVLEPRDLPDREGRADCAVADGRDPIPPGLAAVALVRCPIGWLDVALAPAEDGAAWVGGDLLAPRHALRAAAGMACGATRVDLDQAPIEGSRWPDVIAALEEARAARLRAASAPQSL